MNPQEIEMVWGDPCPSDMAQVIVGFRCHFNPSESVFHARVNEFLEGWIKDVHLKGNLSAEILIQVKSVRVTLGFSFGFEEQLDPRHPVGLPSGRTLLGSPVFGLPSLRIVFRFGAGADLPRWWSIQRDLAERIQEAFADLGPCVAIGAGGVTAGLMPIHA